MKITQTSEGVVIALGKQSSAKVRALSYAEAIVSLGGSLAFIFIAFITFNEAGDYLIATLILLCAAIVFFLAFKRYINKATARESLHVTSHTLTIVNTAILRKSEKKYDVASITNMQFRGKQQMTDHPLKGESFDYMGFQTQQEVINSVHDEGNMSFDYDGKTIFFGKSVPSWDAEEIDRAILQTTDNKLSIGNLPESMQDMETN